MKIYIIIHPDTGYPLLTYIDENKTRDICKINKYEYIEVEVGEKGRKVLLEIITKAHKENRTQDVEWLEKSL